MNSTAVALTLISETVRFWSDEQRALDGSYLPPRAEVPALKYELVQSLKQIGGYCKTALKAETARNPGIDSGLNIDQGTAMSQKTSGVITEVYLHVRVQTETKDTRVLFTIQTDTGQVLCSNAPLGTALKSIQTVLERRPESATLNH